MKEQYLTYRGSKSSGIVINYALGRSILANTDRTILKEGFGAGIF